MKRAANSDTYAVRPFDGNEKGGCKRFLMEYEWSSKRWSYLDDEKNVN